jgi:hypothetical protein
MNEQMMKMLEVLANKLGTTAEHLWAILIKQAYITAWTDIILLIAFIVLLFILGKISFKFLVNFDRILVSIIIVTVLCMLMGNFIPEIVNGFFNPEYWAFKNILSCIK